ncbi:hypothetical protein CC1G_07628 [Coprinopsis cinerea okayama7|uniref:DASH complex subunit DAM1 n=1 Tax=Coprinopsis cinerea (strain Okayama-7 / 130 / ATCC MYA-4618 / FGSC 9003) TaxID=240176 RepID=A8NC24_COPC7|nr:hypothetical protein CC1G_07628 [Coprinopsis cinerea okayama7\|eukprot:XP_001832368.1 hypothetical protein CC1G_07628 [Coprinopsis cinerea okayama7\
MTEFLDEAETLQTNMEGIKQLSESLATFNESFASWLYVMNMNALTTDWIQIRLDSLNKEQVRRDELAQSFAIVNLDLEKHAREAAEALQRAQAEEKARMEREALQAQAQAQADRTAMTEMTEVDTTYLANTTTATTSTTNKSALPPKKKPGAKPKMTAKERKERSMELERIISCLPLEFRGSDPGLRRNMETVIEGLMNAPNNTVKLPDLIKPPDLNQARVNKCLIALVNRKAVQKDNSTGTVLYRWVGIP